MVYVDADKCVGCGTCVEVCPVGAISIIGNTAKVDQERCTDCEACVEACPTGAMLAVREPVAERAAVPSVRPAPEVIRVRPQAVPVSLRTRAVPAIGAALTFLGRNVAPRLADYLLNALDRRLSQGQASPAVRAPGSVSPASDLGGRGPSTGLRRAQSSRSGRGRRRRSRRGRGRR